MRNRSFSARQPSDVWLLYEILFVNGKRYFGITSKTLDERLSAHRASVKKGSRFPVHCAMRKYDFTASALIVGKRDFICELEIAVIAKFKTLNRRNGYNLAPGGDISPMLSPKVAKKISKIQRARFETIPKKLRALPLKTPEARAANAESIRRPEVSAAKSAKLTGLKRTKAVRAKLSAIQRDPEHRKRLSEKVRVAWANPELRARQSARLKGYVKTPEHRQKLREAALRQWSEANE